MDSNEQPPPDTVGPDAPVIDPHESVTAIDAPAPAIRFCSACGTPWDPTWRDCVTCAGHQRALQEARSVQHDGHKVDRSVIRAIVLYFAILAVSAVLIVIVIARGYDLSGEEDLAAGIAMAVVTLVFCAMERDGLAPLLSRLGGLRWWVAAPIMALGTFGVAHVAVTFLTHVMGVEAIGYSEPFYASGFGFGMIVITICVLPAVFEELAFRGIILSALDRVLSPIEAMIVSSCMFAILHLSIPSAPHLLVIGLALAILRRHSGSLYPCMLMHFTHNLLAVVVEQL